MAARTDVVSLDTELSHSIMITNGAQSRLACKSALFLFRHCFRCVALDESVRVARSLQAEAVRGHPLPASRRGYLDSGDKFGLFGFFCRSSCCSFFALVFCRRDLLSLGWAHARVLGDTHLPQYEEAVFGGDPRSLAAVADVDHRLGFVPRAVKAEEPPRDLAGPEALVPLLAQVCDGFLRSPQDPLAPGYLVRYAHQE